MTRVTYAVPRWLATLLTAAAVVFTAGTVRSPMPERFLVGVLAGATAFEAFRAWALRPTVAADPDCLTVVSGVTRRRFAWSEVQGIGTLQPPERGGNLRRRADALEIDLGDEVLLVPRYRLGVPATDAAAALGKFLMTTASSP